MKTENDFQSHKQQHSSSVGKPIQPDSVLHRLLTLIARRIAAKAASITTDERSQQHNSAIDASLPRSRDHSTKDIP